MQKTAKWWHLKQKSKSQNEFSPRTPPIKLLCSICSFSVSDSPGSQKSSFMTAGHAKFSKGHIQDVHILYHLIIFCLKYILHDVFCDPTPSSRRDATLQKLGHQKHESFMCVCLLSMLKLTSQSQLGWVHLLRQIQKNDGPKAVIGKNSWRIYQLLATFLHLCQGTIGGCSLD